MKTIILWMACLAWILAGSTAMAQDEASAAPQILTSDLTNKQLLLEPTKAVSFIFVDDDLIVDITINGEPVGFIPARTVVVNRRFTFNPGTTVIKVMAADEAGNRREKSYLVGYGLEDTGEFSSEDAAAEDPGLFWKVSFGLALENDDNPTNDLSLPISIGDLEISGVIPDDEQPDQRRVLKGTAVIGWKNLTGFAGLSQTTYSRSENAYLNSQAIFFGAGYRHPLSSKRSLTVNLLWLDINVSGEDFSQNITLSPGIQSTSEDDEGSYKHWLGVDYTTKTFADSALDPGSQMVLKWTYDSLDADKLDRYQRTFAYGTNDNGTEVSKSTFWLFDYDWRNRWESGFKWDLGFGFQYRAYQHEVPLSTETPLGTTRTDFPLRLSTGLGWQFTPDWNVMYNYRYTFNLSNKSPYVRSIQGLTLSGAF